MKKSKIVRDMIASAKAKGQSAEDIIPAVMHDLGFARQLARTYINNNWNKVASVRAPVAAPAVKPASKPAAKVAAAPASKPAKALSMSKDAIRKREARARAKAAKSAANAEVVQPEAALF